MAQHPITSYRHLHGLSLAAFAAPLGASKGMVSKWERGLTLPARRYRDRIAATYGLRLVPSDSVPSINKGRP